MEGVLMLGVGVKLDVLLEMRMNVKGKWQWQPWSKWWYNMGEWDWESSIIIGFLC